MYKDPILKFINKIDPSFKVKLLPRTGDYHQFQIIKGDIPNDLGKELYSKFGFPLKITINSKEGKGLLLIV